MFQATIQLITTKVRIQKVPNGNRFRGYVSRNSSEYTVMYLNLAGVSTISLWQVTAIPEALQILFKVFLEVRKLYFLLKTLKRH